MVAPAPLSIATVIALLSLVVAPSTLFALALAARRGAYVLITSLAGLTIGFGLLALLVPAPMDGVFGWAVIGGTLVTIAAMIHSAVRPSHRHERL